MEAQRGVTMGRAFIEPMIGPDGTLALQAESERREAADQNGLDDATKSAPFPPVRAPGGPRSQPEVERRR